MSLELLTMDEAAEYLRVSGRTLKRWVANGQISSIKLGRKRLFRRADVEALVEQNLITKRRRLVA